MISKREIPNEWRGHNEIRPQGFSVGNVHQLPPTNTIPSDKWLVALASMSSSDRFNRWPGAFNSHGQVISRGYGSPAIVTIEGEEVYAVHYGNVQLTGVDHDRFKVRRLVVGVKTSDRGGNVKKGVVVKKGFETRVKMGMTTEEYLAKRDVAGPYRKNTRKRAAAKKKATTSEPVINMDDDATDSGAELVSQYSNISS